MTKPSGQIIEFMDKFCSQADNFMLHKPAAAVTSARRAGTTATLDVLLKYLEYHQMPVVSSYYIISKYKNGKKGQAAFKAI